jgi:hypothetical protein
VGPDGNYNFTTQSERSASYIARPVAAADCDSQPSTPVDVLVKAGIKVTSSNRCRLKGVVLPNHSGTEVSLERKRRRGWAETAVDQLNAGSRFVLRAGRRCRGVARIMWRSQSVTNETVRKRLRF